MIELWSLLWTIADFGLMAKGSNLVKFKSPVTLSFIDKFLWNFAYVLIIWCSNIFFNNLTYIDICKISFLLYKPWWPSWIYANESLKGFWGWQPLWNQSVPSKNENEDKGHVLYLYYTVNSCCKSYHNFNDFLKIPKIR